MIMKRKEGILFVVSGPSGAGKGTICKAYLENHPEITMSISVTTRKPRTGEVDGVNYYFVTEEEFRSMRDKGEFIEWANFCDNYYGTPGEKVKELLAEGKDVLLEIELQGAMQMRSKFPEGVYIFTVPPSFEELKKRLIGRGTESPEVVEQRLETAYKECQNMNKYNYIVINDTVPAAVDRLAAIIEAEKIRTERNGEWIEEFLSNR